MLRNGKSSAVQYWCPDTAGMHPRTCENDWEGFENAGSSFRRVVAAGTLLSAGRMGIYGMAFLRNVILARLLSKANFWSGGDVWDDSLDVGVGHSNVVPPATHPVKNGDSVREQANAHGLQLLLGLASALLESLCVPLAVAFGARNQAWAFAALAVVPFCKVS